MAVVLSEEQWRRFDDLDRRLVRAERSIQRGLDEHMYGMSAERRVANLRASVLGIQNQEPSITGLSAWLPPAGKTV
jgi:hypothetical protein